MLTKHQNVYSRAHCRVYLLGEQSFWKRYPSFELSCGNGLANNLAMPMQPDISKHIPNQFLFVKDSSWQWLPYKERTDESDVLHSVKTLLTRNIFPPSVP
jgi:hypothetical protein